MIGRIRIHENILLYLWPLFLIFGLTAIGLIPDVREVVLPWLLDIAALRFGDTLKLPVGDAAKDYWVLLNLVLVASGRICIGVGLIAITASATLLLLELVRASGRSLLAGIKAENVPVRFASLLSAGFILVSWYLLSTDTPIDEFRMRKLVGQMAGGLIVNFLAISLSNLLADARQYMKRE